METKIIKFTFGDVRKKKIVTSNHFVSHMLEHIAWRMGLSIELEWSAENWKELGRAFGAEIKKFSNNTSEAAALGMIDDGSAAIAITLGKSEVVISAVGGVDLEWFLNSRCEQIASGKPLTELLQGLSEGLQAQISVQIWSVEDPHHTWEGIYRGIGMALARIFIPETERAAVSALMSADLSLERNENIAEIVVLEKGIHRSRVRRGTAETGIVVGIDFLDSAKSDLQLEVDDSINNAVKDANKLFNAFAKALGISLTIDFRVTNFSSSHVVMEDIGLVIGRALLEILKPRMEKYGVNGAGSNLSMPSDIKNKNVQVGVSVEGRKFWRLIPEDGDYDKLRRDLIIGHDIFNGLRSEDLDDFIDGLAGGMNASVAVHIKDYSTPGQVWPEIFQALGIALGGVFFVNLYRRGVPPGVKATLV